ncbi:hypothetical protein HG531_000066 [Fusarium graminearum]|nr:hypothetical protein HG531_000066 [Fusarium graminearum]
MPVIFSFSKHVLLKASEGSRPAFWKNADQIRSLEALHPRCRRLDFLLEKIRLFNSNESLVDIRGKGKTSEEDGGPDPLDRKRDLVRPLVHAGFYTSRAALGDKLADDERHVDGSERSDDLGVKTCHNNGDAEEESPEDGPWILASGLAEAEVVFFDGEIAGGVDLEEFRSLEVCYLVIIPIGFFV